MAGICRAEVKQYLLVGQLRSPVSRNRARAGGALWALVLTSNWVLFLTLADGPITNAGKHVAETHGTRLLVLGTEPRHWQAPNNCPWQLADNAMAHGHSSHSHEASALSSSGLETPLSNSCGRFPGSVDG